MHGIDETAPSILYHYTTCNGLLGILETNKLWASDVRYLNDSKEIDYGLEMIRSICHEFAPSISAAHAERLRTLTETLSVVDTTYAACFCESDDLLSQWRAYGSGDGSTGYSLGFQVDGLPSGSGMSVDSVIYDPRHQRDRTVSLVNSTLNDDALEETDKWNALFWLLQMLAVRMKHPSFEAEREWRLMLSDPSKDSQFSPPDNLRHRPGRFAPIPYVEIEPLLTVGANGAKLLRLASVRYGPSSAPKLAREALESILWRYGYESVAVLGSEAPLRV
jgi:Protein of unknown function (DUF2971)